MQSKDELLRAAQRAVSMRRQRAIMAARTNQQRVREEIPGYAAAEDTISQAGYKAAHLAATGHSSEKIEAALAESEAAQRRCAQLLRENGWSEADLQPQFTCPLCGDTGLDHGRICSCIHTLERDMRREEIVKASALNISCFESMDVNRYPNAYHPLLGCTVRQYMAERLQELKEYADAFDLRSSNLLLCGSAGLGKTHAALAIAGIVLDKGYDVIYISSQELFGHLDKVRRSSFSDEEAMQDSMMDAVLSADLLILDDLGTEYFSQYVASCLYTVLNSRIGHRLPTIYTTNITDDRVFESRYTEKIASRLTGSCERVEFYGSDIRKMEPESDS